ncbi:hypothetical protein KIPB_009564, partial [Kipferlia bialata]|eukprot:g9564.t1
MDAEEVSFATLASPVGGAVGLVHASVQSQAEEGEGEGEGEGCVGEWGPCLPRTHVLGLVCLGVDSVLVLMHAQGGRALDAWEGRASDPAPPSPEGTATSVSVRWEWRRLPPPPTSVRGCRVIKGARVGECVYVVMVSTQEQGSLLLLCLDVPSLTWKVRQQTPPMEDEEEADEEGCGMSGADQGDPPLSDPYDMDMSEGYSETDMDMGGEMGGKAKVWPGPRTGSVVWGMGGGLYLIGGEVGYGHERVALGDCWRYDTETHLWEEMPPIPGAASAHPHALDINGSAHKMPMVQRDPAAHTAMKGHRVRESVSATGSVCAMVGDQLHLFGGLTPSHRPS